MSDPTTPAASNELIANSSDMTASLYDWLDFYKTPRKILARRLINRSFGTNESVMMREAKHLLDDGRISIITRVEKTAFGHRATYLAERVKW